MSEEATSEIPQTMETDSGPTSEENIEPNPDNEAQEDTPEEVEPATEEAEPVTEEADPVPEPATEQANETEQEVDPEDAEPEAEESAESNENEQENTESNGDEEKNPFDMLTPELTTNILSYLDIPDLMKTQLVCKDWFEYSRGDALWIDLYESTDWSLSPPANDGEPCTWYQLYQKHYEKELQHINSEYYSGEMEDEAHGLLQILPSSDQINAEKVRVLLGKEEFVTSLQNGNDITLTFLEAPSTITAMMSLLFDEKHDIENPQNQRIIHIVVQTLISGIITDVFIMNTDLLDTLFDHLDTVDFRESDAFVKSNCIAKILSIMFDKFTTQMIDHFHRRDTFIPTLLFNIHDQNLMELLYKFIECDITHQWLFESDLITRLIALLHKDEPLETQENAAGVLVSILALCQSWSQSLLINEMLNNEVITGSLIAYMESKPIQGEAIKLGLRVLIGILGLISDELEDPPVVVTLLANAVGFFSSILVDSDNTSGGESVVTSTGPIEKGFGFVRLSVLEMLVSLLYTGFPIVVEFMLEESVFSVSLDLLFLYPWNNIIHNQISQLFSGLFCCNNPEIIQTVLEDSRLPERIAQAHTEREETKVGYLGHLRELANELVRTSKMSEPIAEYLSSKPSWVQFVEEDLKEFNLVECVVQDDYLDYENEFFQDQYEYGGDQYDEGNFDEYEGNPDESEEF